MVGKSHQMVGFATVYTYAVLTQTPYLNTQTLVAALLCITLGSLTPDLDSQENKLYTLLPFGHKVLAEVGERAFGKHRTISHSLIGVTIAWFLSYWLIFMIPVENGFNLTALWYAYMLALISHLFADFVTKDGIPLLWPISFKFGFPPFKFMRMRTGGWIELYIVRSLVVFWVFYLTIVNWNVVKVMLGWG
ncbi:MAG: metal-dependent hydrolase [bacterium]|nr:metal-dependent hydrolase [bacterium]